MSILDEGADSYPANRWWIAAGMIGASLVNGLGNSMIGVALPQVRGALGVTVSEMVWPGIASSIALTMMLPLSAWVGARFGRRRVLLVGLGMMCAGNLVSGLAQTLAVLATCRFFAALGGGVIVPINQAVMAESFPPHERAAALSIYTFGGSVAAILGPSIGGYLVDLYGWQTSYFCAAVGSLGSLSIVQRVVRDPSHFERRRDPVDYVGIGLLLGTVSFLQLLLQRGGATGWFESPWNVVSAGLCVACAMLFVAHELETPHPAVHLRILRSRALSASAAVGVVQATVLFSTGFLLPLFMQDVLGYSPRQAGFALFSEPLMWLSATLVLRRFAERAPRTLVVVGLAVVGFTAVLQGRYTMETSSHDILWNLALNGVGMPCIVLPLWAIAFSGVERARMPHATAVFNLIVVAGASCGTTALVQVLGRMTMTARDALAIHVAATDPQVLGMVAGAQQSLMRRSIPEGAALEQAIRGLSGAVGRQATVLGYNHLFTLLGVACFAALPLVFLLPARAQKPSLSTGSRGSS